MLGFMATLNGLHHVALSVKDLDASAAWYRDLFGLEEDFRQESDERRSIVLRLPGTTQQVGLVEHRPSGQGFMPQNLGLDHVAFAVASSEEMRAWAARLHERGVASSGVLETPFGAMLNLTDLDGIALALFWVR